MIIDAGNVEISVPKNKHPIGKVAHILSSASAKPINAEVAIMRELPDSISAGQPDKINTLRRREAEIAKIENP